MIVDRKLFINVVFVFIKVLWIKLWLFIFIIMYYMFLSVFIVIFKVILGKFIIYIVYLEEINFIFFESM